MSRLRRWLTFPVAVYLTLLAVVVVFAAWTMAQMPTNPEATAEIQSLEAAGLRHPHSPWLAAWTVWDSMWYGWVAERGYWGWDLGPLAAYNFKPHAFFPLYPLLMAAIAAVTPLEPLYAGILISVLSGLGSALLFYRWCRARMSAEAARLALLALLLHPFAFFLYGMAYAEAFFLFLSLAAFALLEDDRPVAAGLAGALCGASRVLAVATIAGLVLRALERRGALAFGPPDRSAAPAPGALAALRPRLDLRALRARDLGVLLSPLGFVAYMGYLWWRGGSPFLFVTAHQAWGVSAGYEPLVETFRWFQEVFEEPWKAGYVHVQTLANGVAIAGGLVLLPRAFRTFGAGYGLYAATLLAIPLLTVPKFMGVGRYPLVAFPLAAALGIVLSRCSPGFRRGLLVVSGGAMLCLLSLFARWYYY